MLACSSTKRYAFEHNLMATELKCDIYGLCSAIKWPFMAIYTKYMANIVIAYDALVVRGDTVKILYMWDEKSKFSGRGFASLTQPFKKASPFGGV